MRKQAILERSTNGSRSLLLWNDCNPTTQAEVPQCKTWGQELHRTLRGTGARWNPYVNGYCLQCDAKSLAELIDKLRESGWTLRFGDAVLACDCTCPQGCDCQAPDGNPALGSNHCPKHNEYPSPCPTCPLHGSESP